jgi:sugar/nucleoside kinase (ribokinase family)
MPIEAVCMGEILADLIPVEPGPYRDGMVVEVHFGGAPANVAVAIARLGHRSGFIGAVGRDPLGYMLKSFLEIEGVDTRGVVVKDYRTSLAFVALSEGGERDFFFYRAPWVVTADTMLSPEDVSYNLIDEARILHVSGVSTAYPPLSEAVHSAMNYAFRRGKHVSFDPNYRADIWGSGEKALKAMDRFLKASTIVTMGLDEAVTMFSSSDPREVAEKVMKLYTNVDTVAVRLGRRGAYVRTRGKEVYAPAYEVKAVDTTGAGDAWTAAFIVFHILEGKDLETSVKLSNAFAALKCLRRGAVTGIPRRKEFESFVKSLGLSV